MMRRFLKIPVYLFCLLALSTCIDPYFPELSHYQSLLVVDGLVTDQDVPYEIYLSRTFQSTDSIPGKVNNATVYITDETGKRSDFYFAGSGIYKSKISEFKGQTGKTYILHIETADGKKYASEPCPMLPVAGIDSVYYTKEQEAINTSANTLTGLMVYLDTDENTDGTGYYRWEYEETWKFAPPSPQEYIYISDKEIIKIENVKKYCWKNNKSANIMIAAVSPDQNSIKKEPLIFIPTALSDRFTIQYSILIRQYSISPKEYGFWDNLKQVNETGGDIYDVQPYPVFSNIFNIDNPDEKVLGYFKVSSVRNKRVFITASETKALGVPAFKYDCIERAVSPDDYFYPGSQGSPPTWDEVYEMFMKVGGFVFIKPIFLGLSTEVIQKLVFTTEECSDCEKTGTVKQPDFWVNLK